MADKFMAYAEKRSIYFDNNFTHKTFLEYYTAYWIFSNVEKKHDAKKRDEIISEFIINPFWFIVLELYFNMIDSDQPDNEILDALYREQVKKNDLSIPCLLSIFPTLKNVSQVLPAELVSRSIDVLLAFEKDRKEDYDNLAPDHAEFTIFAGLRNQFESTFYPRYKNLILDEMKKREVLPGTNLPGLYALYLELLDFRKAVPRKDFEIGQAELYENTIQEHPYLYFMDYYHQWPFVKGAPIETHTYYISHFGDSMLYQEMQTRYSKQLYTGFIHVIISSLCLDWDRSSRIRAMVGSGLDVTKFLTYLTDLNRTDLANVVSDEAALVDFLGSEQEIVYLQAVLLSLIKVFRYNKGSVDSIIDQIQDPQKREQVRDLAVTNRQNKIKWVMDGAALARQQQAVQK
jgi:hypothetical protein